MNRTHWAVAASLMALCGGAALAQGHDARRSGMASPRDNAVAAATATVRTIDFAGITWTAKNSGGALWGPGPCVFSDAPGNIWVDSLGNLHLKITNENNVWKCAEVIAQKSLGYGTYRFTVGSDVPNLGTDVSNLDPNVVLGLFTWNDDPAFDHREIDIEFSRWGDASDSTNAQYVVQPYTANGNLQRWTVNQYAQASHSFRWNKASIDFESKSAGNVLKQWSYTRRAGIPKPGGENPRINLWLFQGAAPQNGLPVEVVISRFEFLR